MDKILLLKNIAYTYKVKIIYKDLHTTKHPLLEGFAWPARKLIVLDQSLQSRVRQKKCVLAEEIGHCLYPPAADHITYHYTGYRQLNCWERHNLAALVVKDERLALKWGTSFLLPDAVFWEYVLSGHYEWEEWLDYFDVEDWFLRIKIGFMQAKYPTKWKELIKKCATG